jgi:hypothetical protein
VPLRTALIAALAAVLVLSGAGPARAEPVVYQADPQAADCSGGCGPASDAAGGHRAGGGTSGSRPAQRDATDSRSGHDRSRAAVGAAGHAGSRGGPASGRHGGGATAPSAPTGADTTSGAASGDRQPSPATAGDPFSSLGGRSPSCQKGAVGQAAANCRATGSPAHRYPIGNYTYDIKIDTGLTHFSDNLLAALQTLASFVWLGLLYAIKGILLALDWAFHLNLINTNIDKVHGGLLEMDRIFGLDSSYFSLALTLAALWGMWHGFVRGKYIETIAGLGACLGLMLIALLIVHDPAGTVGKVGGWGDAAGREVASGVAGAVQPGDQAQASEDGLDRGAQAIFDTVVLRPWCALEFGDVDFCLSKPPAAAKYYDKQGAYKYRADAASAPTIADLWLRFPANGDERNALYESWKSDDDTATQSRVQMMQGQSTGKRLALLAIITVGLLGALLLLGWIAFWLIAFAALALFFLLIAPFVFLLPALGEAGRQGFISWGKRLVGALIAKLLYAIVLGVVIYVAAVVAEMGNPGALGWLGVWVVEAIFWWVAFLKRHELVNLLTLNAANGGQGSATRRDGLAGLYFKTRLAQEAMRTVGRPVASRVRRHAAREAMTEAQAAGSVARERLANHADRALDVEYDTAHEKLVQRRAHKNELRAVEGALRPAEEARSLRVAGGQAASPLQPDEEERLRARRAELQELIDTPDMRQAEQLVGRADTNRAEHGRRWTSSDHERWVERQRRELAGNSALTEDPSEPGRGHERLIAAGIDPARYEAATPDEQRDMMTRLAHTERIQRDLLRSVPADGDVPRLRSNDLRALRRHVHDDEWRRARTRERRAIQRDAWRRRARENIYRVRR